MQYPSSFLALIDYLEAFQLPPRHRLREGETIGGKVLSPVVITSTARGTSTPPLIKGSALARIGVQASIIGCQPIGGHIVAPVEIRGASHARQERSPVKPKPRSRERKKELPGTRPRRSAEAIAASAAKLREQRLVRVNAVLPLVAEARAAGCVLLRDICCYLDRIGHKAPQGPCWSAGTLSTMLPRAEERKGRSDGFVALINQARSEGAETHAAIADWLNAHDHRTARGMAWTGCNVSRFIRSLADSEP